MSEKQFSYSLVMHALQDLCWRDKKHDWQGLGPV